MVNHRNIQFGHQIASRQSGYKFKKKKRLLQLHDCLFLYKYFLCILMLQTIILPKCGKLYFLYFANI